ncbi:MAG: dinB [Actinomycetia bacterium]|nr:dinB [Actinomycetes bacterium]
MTGPSILHVDMDAFFVSVELLDQPELRGRPVVVGGAGDRGVVAAASYEARHFGVHSAMPSTRARRMCPHAVFLKGRYWRYQEVSTAVFEIFRSATPLVEGISLDEAFLDVSGSRRLLGDGPTIAADIRRRILEEQGLTCSVGVAPRKLTAKLASEAAKPKASITGPVFGPGVFVIQPEEELAFLHALPVGALWGVGPATKARLDRLAVRTVGDLAALSEDAVVAALGTSQGRHLHALAWARDDRPVVPDAKVKSIGHEETFAKDHHTHATLERELLRLADAVATRLRKAGVTGRTVQLKVRFHDFETITRAETVPEGIDEVTALVRVGRRLLAGIDPSPGVRLLGISVSQLTEGAARQLTFDEAEAPGWTGATQAIDEIRERFGDAAIGPAALAGTKPKRRGDTQWGPGN